VHRPAALAQPPPQACPYQALPRARLFVSAGAATGLTLPPCLPREKQRVSRRTSPTTASDSGNGATLMRPSTRTQRRCVHRRRARGTHPCSSARARRRRPPRTRQARSRCTRAHVAWVARPDVRALQELPRACALVVCVHGPEGAALGKLAERAARQLERTNCLDVSRGERAARRPFEETVAPQSLLL
jgi:hypothetical protein